MSANDTASQRQNGRWFRAVLPMVLWVALVVVLFAMENHRRLLATTRLRYDILLEGAPTWPDVRVDGIPVHSGANVKPGRREILIVHPKAVPVRREISIRNGENSLGMINLERAKGRLDLSVTPRASRVSIMGADFTEVVSNVTTFSADVPTGDYSIYAQFAHSMEKRSIAIKANHTEAVTLDGQLGALSFTANQDAVQVIITAPDGKTIGSGVPPLLLTELPVGRYIAEGKHKGRAEKKDAIVNAGTTNRIEFDFVYGAVEITTVPAGATLFGGSGKELGTTPVILSDLIPGRAIFDVRLQGHDPLRVEFDVRPNQTNRLVLSLTNTLYRISMAEGRDRLARKEFAAAADAFKRAQDAKSEDSAARELENEARGLGHLETAQRLYSARDLLGAIREIGLARARLPMNTEIENLERKWSAEHRSRIELMADAKRRRPLELFNEITSRDSLASGFDTHTLKSKMQVREAALAVVAEVKRDPAFKLTVNTVPEAGAFHIEGEREYLTALKTVAGKTKCVFVGGELPDGGSEVRFKVIQLKAEAKEKFSIGNVIGASVAVNFVSLPSGAENTGADNTKERLSSPTVAARFKRSLGVEP